MAILWVQHDMTNKKISKSPFITRVIRYYFNDLSQLYEYIFASSSCPINLLEISEKKEKIIYVLYYQERPSHCRKIF